MKIALVGGATAVVLAGGSVAAMAVASGSLGTGNGWGPGASTLTGRSCVAPALGGSVVDVELTDMGSAMHRWEPGSGGYGGMMGGQMMDSRWRGRMMQVRLSRHSVPAGTGSLRVSDVGVMDHELIVLPLADRASVGRRDVGPDGTVDERGSLGEVSNNCGAGAGEGLHLGGTGWTTLQLRPGRYELVCNLPVTTPPGCSPSWTSRSSRSTSVAGRARPASGRPGCTAPGPSSRQGRADQAQVLQGPQ